MFPKMLSRFKRITTTGAYLAEIDGLRFIAISTVICVHITGIWTANVGRTYETMNMVDRLLFDITLLGGYGVELFFMISGFVLAMPFCRNAYQGGERVDLKKIFLEARNTTRTTLCGLDVFFLCSSASYGKGKLSGNFSKPLGKSRLRAQCDLSGGQYY